MGAKSGKPSPEGTSSFRVGLFSRDGSDRALGRPKALDRFSGSSGNLDTKGGGSPGPGNSRPSPSPMRGPSFNSMSDKPPALFQKSLSQEGLMEYLRQESAALAEKDDRLSSLKSEEFYENPFVLHHPTISLNDWEIHVSNDDRRAGFSVSTLKVTTFSGYRMPVNDTAFHPSGSFIATACGSGEADLFPMPLSADSVRRRKCLGGTRARFGVSAIAFSPDGVLVATAGHDKGVKVWDIDNPTDEPLASTFMHESVVTCIAFASGTGAAHRPAGPLAQLAPTSAAVLATGGGDKPVIFIWALEAGDNGAAVLRELCMLVGHWAWLTSLAFSPDNSYLSSASQDGTVRIWDVEGGEPTAAMGFKSSSATVQHRSRLCKAGYRRITLKELEDSLESDDSENRFFWTPPPGVGGGETLHLCKVQDLDGWGRFVEARFQYVNCANGDIFYTSSGWLQTLKGHSGAVNAVEYSPDGTILATAGQDGTVRLWSAQTSVNREIITDDRFVEGTAGYHVISIEDEMSQSEDPLVAQIETDGNVYRYRIRFSKQGIFYNKGDLLADPATGLGVMYRPQVSFKERMRDPVYQILRDSDGTVLFDWNMAKMELRGHRAAVTCLAFVFGGNMIISSGDDGTLRLWGLDDGLCRAVLTSAAGPWRPVGAVTSLHVLMDPPVLSVADRAGQVHIVEGRVLEPVCPHLFDASS